MICVKSETITFPGGMQKEYRLTESRFISEDGESGKVFGIEIICQNKIYSVEDIDCEEEFVFELMRKMEESGALNILECAEDALEEKYSKSY